jgi:hypothetical protein
LKYVLTFNFKNRNNILKRLKGLNENKQLYIFKNDKQADKFLKQVEIN